MKTIGKEKHKPENKEYQDAKRSKFEIYQLVSPNVDLRQKLFEYDSDSSSFDKVI